MTVRMRDLFALLSEAPGKKPRPPSGQAVPIDWDELSDDARKQHDRFTDDEAEFVRVVSSAAGRFAGRDWKLVIDAAYDKGDADRLLKGLWDNFWTPYEAVMEVGHYYDVAQRSLEDPDAVAWNKRPLTDVYPIPKRLVKAERDGTERQDRPMAPDFWAGIDWA